MNKTLIFVFIILIFWTRPAQSFVLKPDTSLSPSKTDIHNYVKNKYSVELNNGLGYGFIWTHFLESQRVKQIYLQIGLAQFFQIYGPKSVTIPMSIGLNANRSNHFFCFIETGVTINTDPGIKTLSEARDVYFNGKVAESGSTFPIEQPVGLGVGYNWTVFEKYHIALSAGPYIVNVFNGPLGVIFKIQLGYSNEKGR